jgi:carboxyl-terminal processing protease
VKDADRLVQVDDLPITADTGIEPIQAAVRGPVGSRVRITIQRPPELTRMEISIQRAEIPLPSVAWNLDPDQPKVGIVEVNLIAATSRDEIEKAIQDLQSRGAEAFILDLRDNFGGLLTAGVDIARMFLEDGTVIEQQYRGQDVETYRVDRPGPYADLPLAVLVNQHTASAAEIIAGAIQAQKRAPLVGQNTYGKDSIQLIFDLGDGSSIHVTAAKWWVPGLAEALGGVGLQPDVPVEPGDPAQGPDPVVRAGVDFLMTTP